MAKYYSTVAPMRATIPPKQNNPFWHNHHPFWQPSVGGSPMLVLSRLVGQSVMIGDDIRVNIVGVKPSKNTDGEDSFLVRLGFEAPDEIEIYRSEIYQQRQKGSGSS